MQQFRIQRPRNDKEMCFRLFDVIQYLKDQGYRISNTQVSYYSVLFSSFVNCNLDPVSKNIWLSDEDLQNIDNQLSLRLRFQKGVQWKFTQAKSAAAEVDSDGMASDENGGGENQGVAAEHSESGGEAGTRGRERNVGYVIEKVTQWRRLYNGYYDKDFNHHRMSLDQAAETVGVSKKSLDDYLA